MNRMPMRLIFLGAPGAGKGTQAEYICEKLDIPSVSTGNILKAAIKNGTALGEKAKSYMDRGMLVPDEIVIDIVRERISQPDCEKGFLFDGFPRTVAQAQALDSMGVKLDRVVEIRVPDEKIIQRISGRRSCPDCGGVYHTVYNRPKTEGICDKCGTALVIRSDDMPQTVAKRLEVYHTQTQPLVDFYAQKGILSGVDGEQSPQAVSASIMEVLGL